MTRLLLIGAGGHAAACLDVLEAGRVFVVAGLVDPKFPPGSRQFGYPVLGDDEVLATLRENCDAALVALGQIKSSSPRRRLASLLRDLGFRLPVVVAPSAHLSASAEIGEGGIVMHGAVIGPGVVVGAMAIVNNKALVEHGCRVGDFVHVATGATVNGDCLIGDDCFIGSGAVILQGVTIGPRSIVSAGSVVRSDLPADSVFKG